MNFSVFLHSLWVRHGLERGERARILNSTSGDHQPLTRDQDPGEVNFVDGSGRDHLAILKPVDWRWLVKMAGTRARFERAKQVDSYLVLHRREQASILVHDRPGIGLAGGNWVHGEGDGCVCEDVGSQCAVMAWRTSSPPERDGSATLSMFASRACFSQNGYRLASKMEHISTRSLSCRMSSLPLLSWTSK